ncbi:TAXI family TRAP transporter solute-binding subunit [Hyphomicrobium sp.]|uniref:TAXI family TRAP transporter solute-binding subunit n=1 Tax=Hyphomicrobium sp. TaxID=82 RepID=UPI001E0B049E|nr:TAXI family TRAP transporter solute-binding subunit [Hyphomicrobium sp.]MBY0558871.1 ABC transporter substrate-binding protein [Hyphomicrobium sp.]
MRSRFVRFQLRDLLLIAVPVLLAVAAATWFTFRLAHPAPPDTLVLSAAAAGSPYYRYAERYRAVFERNGVKLEIRESGGSLANLKSLSDPGSGVDAAFVQGGLALNNDTHGLLSLGRIAYEPLWVFYNGSTPLERLTELKGKRILVGPAGSGTSSLALRLLAANGITNETATLINHELPDYVDLLAKGEADAGFLVLAPEAKTIQRLLRTPDIHFMSFANADAYAQRFPFLSRLVLREGVVDFAANVPHSDTTLIATTVAVVVRESLHPALVNLLAQALQEVHGQSTVNDAGEVQLFQNAGEFPTANDPEFAFSDEARRVYRSGAPLLQRYVPFWVATTVDRLMISLVVLVPILIPLLRFAPQIYDWRIRRRIIHWYGELKRLEASAKSATTSEERAAKLRDLETIEAAVDNLPIPLGFADRLYQLRQHIELARRRLTFAGRF